MYLCRDGGDGVVLSDDEEAAPIPMPESSLPRILREATPGEKQIRTLLGDRPCQRGSWASAAPGNESGSGRLHRGRLSFWLLLAGHAAISGTETES